jgi:hypothetical protein
LDEESRFFQVSTELGRLFNGQAEVLETVRLAHDRSSPTPTGTFSGKRRWQGRCVCLDGYV